MNSLDNTKTVTYMLEAVAHEIRNPLTVVGGFARRLAKSLDPESEVSKYAQVILEEALRLEKVFAAISECGARERVNEIEEHYPYGHTGLPNRHKERLSHDDPALNGH